MYFALIGGSDQTKLTKVETTYYTIIYSTDIMYVCIFYNFIIIICNNDYVCNLQERSFADKELQQSTTKRHIIHCTSMTKLSASWP